MTRRGGRAHNKRAEEFERTGRFGKHERELGPGVRGQPEQTGAGMGARSVPRKGRAAGQEQEAGQEQNVGREQEARRNEGEGARRRRAEADGASEGQWRNAPTAALANLANLSGADFELMADNMAQLVDQGRKALAAAIGGVDPGEARSELAANVADATKTLGVVAEYWLAKPDRAAAAQADLYSGLSEIWRQTLRRYGGEDVAPIVASDAADKRFAAPEWRDNPFFDWLRQSYLLASRWAGDMVEKTEGLDPQMKAKAAFYTRLISSAISPSNFVATNPELLRATIDAKGENLVRGLKMLAEDISAGGGMLKIRQSADKQIRARRRHGEHARQGRLAQ